MKLRKILSIVLALVMVLSMGASAGMYTVVDGDVLWKIAQNYGTTYQELAKLNGIDNPHLIFVGQELTVPSTEDASPSEPTTEVEVSTAKTYTETVKGFMGDFAVDVTIDGDVITAVTVGANNETPTIGGIAIEEVPSLIVEKQSYIVDATSGASITSEAIMEAVKLALTAHGAELAKYEVITEVALAQGETVTTDVVIVGAGISGLMAAYELRAQDPSVNFIVVEKLDKVGGSLPVSGGSLFTLDSSIHQESGTAPSEIEDVLTWFDEIAGVIENEALATNVYSKSPDTISFMQSLGAKFLPETEVSNPLNPNLHLVRLEGRGAGIQAFVEELVEEQPIDLRMETKATELVIEDGSVKGIVVEDERSTYKISADAVVLATGGYGSNEELLAEFSPTLAEAFAFTNAGATGDGFILTESLNINRIGEGAMGSLVASDKSALMPNTFIVNSDGARFISEKTYGPFQLRALTEQEGQIAFAIADSSAEDMSVYETAVAKGTAQKYDTIETLAAAINVDVDALNAELNQYNSDLGAGVSPGFDLSATVAMPVKTAPFYVQNVHLRVNGTFTGLEVNDSLQVVNANGEIIEGLLACGELTVGNAYIIKTPGAGFGISYGANSGRLVADTIVEMFK